MYNQMYYNNFFPYQNLATQPVKRGLLSSLGGLSKISWGTLLNNTQKTLNVINQAIPVYYQIKPIYNNAKTMFRVFGAMNDKSENNNITRTNTNSFPETNTNLNQKNTSSHQPVFFI